MPGVHLTEGRIRKKSNALGLRRAEGPVEARLGFGLYHNAVERERTAALVPTPTDLVATQSLDVLSCRMGVTAGNTPEGLGAVGYIGRAKWCLLLFLPLAEGPSWSCLRLGWR